MLPGWPSYGGTVLLDLAGDVWCNGLLLVVRGAARAAQLQQHHLASTGRCHLVQWHLASGKGVLPGRPGYGSMVWLAPAGTV